MVDPLNLTNMKIIPSNALKSLVDYDVIRKITYEHYLNIIDMVNIHNIYK